MLQPTGSTFIRHTNTSALSFTNGVAAFSAGDLFSDNIALWDFVKVLIPRQNTFIAEQSVENLRLTVNAGTGIMTGHFVDPITGRIDPLKGIVCSSRTMRAVSSWHQRLRLLYSLRGTPPMQ